ncbi:hypothetical protein [Agromyces archimandritae]|uniref:Uncharacterized protein n=1 Tax=Agromyces archimandritae TaxID=2781962 RepID=A0A975FKH7_9MICO|nr:hypothetical protein [Agromyces archimandritae]QTX03644.1 hypothetical protein G127AT_09855 [Agromyces archimandritae]
MKWILRIAVTLAVVFGLFFLITRPEDAASAIQGLVGGIVGVGDSVGRFFSSLASVE